MSWYDDYLAISKRTYTYTGFTSEEEESMKAKELKKKTTKIENIDGSDASLNKFIVNSFESYLGITNTPISSALSLYKINSVVAYAAPKKMPKKKKVNNIPRINNIPPRHLEEPVVEGWTTGRTRGGRQSNWTEQPAEEDRNVFPGVNNGTFTVEMRGGVPHEVTPVDFETAAFGDNPRTLSTNDRHINTLEREIATLRSNIAWSRERATRPQSTQDRIILDSTLRLHEDSLRRLEERLAIARQAPRVQQISDELIDSFYHTTLKATSIYDTPQEVKELSQKETLLQNYEFINIQYGGVPAIIKGYICRGKIYTSNDDIIRLNIKGVHNYRTILKIFNLNKETGEVTSNIITVGNTNFSVIKGTYLKGIIPIIFKAKLNKEMYLDIVGSDMLGLSKERKEVIKLIQENKNYLKDWEVDRVSSKKLSEDSYCITIVHSGRKVKFFFKDFIFINPDLTGYSCPKDRTIDVSTTVKIRRSKLTTYNLMDGMNVAIVTSIKGNPSSKRINKNSRNRRKDIMTVRLVHNDKILTVYGEDLKFLEKPQKVYKEESKLKLKSEYVNSITEEVLNDFRWNITTTILR